MMMMEALAARLKEPPFGDMAVDCVDLCFSKAAMRDLKRELEQGLYEVWQIGEKIFVVEDLKARRCFGFSVDKNLPGKSFVVRVKK